MGDAGWDAEATGAWVEVAKLLSFYALPSEAVLGVVREMLSRTRMTEALSRAWVEVASARTASTPSATGWRCTAPRSEVVDCSFDESNNTLCVYLTHN